MEDIKRALGSTIFLRDLARVDPTKKGLVVGDSLRIIQDPTKGYVLSFLRGTDEKTRKQFKDKLEMSKIAFKMGEDFTQ